MKKLIVVNSIHIDATAAQVWDVLVNPEHTQKYMFGCVTDSDWQVGSPLLWRMTHEGKEIIPVKGTILEIKPNQRLKYTVIDPSAAYHDIPENYLNVTYALEAEQGGTKLTVTQDGFEDAAEGEKRYQDVSNNGEGWNPILVQMKEIAEGS
ncbi:SRPBCC domain-containing protein [Persicitalea sp.]|uniref:SRPBCC domain-containing protein n=1 Tax=Persicitalea sp. TaxID=3100273 RepID=UPI003593B267